jgi:para-nitrobenzyl esterase
VLDGYVLNETPAESIRQGRAARVPLMLGVNDDETTSTIPASSLPSTMSGYEALVRQQNPVIANLILARYPAANYPTPQRAYQDIADDLRFTCANRRAAQEHAANGNPTYHYVLTDALPDAQLAPLESFHGLDISYLFERTNAQAAELDLRRKMQNAWINFARTGEPGLALGYVWPRYASARQSAELKSSATTVINDYRASFCEFWANYVSL